MAVNKAAGQSMSRYSAVLQRQAWIILVVTLLTVWAGTAYTFKQQKLYRSTATLIVEMPLDDLSSTSVQQATRTLSVQLRDPGLARQVVKERRRLGVITSQLSSHLGVSTKPDSATLHVFYDDVDPKRGTVVLTQLTEDFVDWVDIQQKSLLDQSPSRTAKPTGKGKASPPPPGPQLQVRVLDPAHPAGKVQPKPLRNVVLAGMLGLLLGVVAAFVREQFDDTVRGVSEAEEAFGQGATATLPPRLLGHLSSSPPRRGLDPALAELAVQRLAANLLWPSQAQGAKTVLVTSAQPEEGKSTVAANLAVELAASGRRVIVVEADLRRPVLYRYLGLEPRTGVGLDAVIRNRATLTAALLEVPVPGSPGQDGGRLQAILGASAQAWPSEPERVLQVLEALRRRADYVIFDAPPTLVVPDAYPLIGAVDVVVAVIRSGRSSAQATAALSRHLGRLKARRVELVVTDAEEPYEHTYYHAYLSRRPPHERDQAPPAPAPASAPEAAADEAEAGPT